MSALANSVTYYFPEESELAAVTVDGCVHIPVRGTRIKFENWSRMDRSKWNFDYPNQDWIVDEVVFKVIAPGSVSLDGPEPEQQVWVILRRQTE